MVWLVVGVCGVVGRGGVCGVVGDRMCGVVWLVVGVWCGWWYGWGVWCGWWYDEVYGWW